MTYSCVRCGYTALQISHLRSHLKKKSICEPVFSNDEPSAILADLDTAEGRKKHQSADVFSSNQSTLTDLTKVGAPDLVDIVRKLEVELSQSRYEVETLKKQVSQLKRAIKSFEKAENTILPAVTTTDSNNNNTDSNNNTTDSNNKTINIHINNFGSENLSYLTPEFMKALMCDPNVGVNDAIPEIVRHIHFNPDHPENHNVKARDEESVLVRKSGAWKEADATRTIDKMLDNATNNAANAKTKGELFDERTPYMKQQVFDACVLKGMKKTDGEAKQLGRKSVRKYMKPHIQEA
jgi:hypothetical protein